MNLVNIHTHRHIIHKYDSLIARSCVSYHGNRAARAADSLTDMIQRTVMQKVKRNHNAKITGDLNSS